MSSAARSVMLAQKWDEKKDVVGWWMSEKLDGVRAYWSGSSFFSRNGIKFEAPDFFTRDLPRVPLDGELWCGRGLFSKTVSIIKKTKDWEKHADDWKYVTYLVFDAPGESTGYETRVAYMKKLIQDEKQSTYAAVVGIEKCRSKEHLQECMDKVIARGGEGLMLRKPNSKYECCRSHNLLKVKLFHSEEAKVVGTEKGTGRCSFMMGKLHCILPNKVAFKVGTGFSDAQRKRPPPIGSIIEFKYQEISDHGHPRFPVFLRERGDLTWEDVCNAAKKKKPFSELKTYKAPLLKKQHSILFSTVPSRDDRGKKIVTEDDDDDDVDISTSTSSHPACKYGADCYRTDERHIEAYTHPKSDKKDKRGRSPSPSPVRGRSPVPDRDKTGKTDKPDKTDKSDKTDKTDKSDKSEKKERSAVEEERDARLEREARDRSKSPTVKKRKAGDGKPPCRFGAKCYRTSKEHLADFSHPSSADAEDIENEEAQQVELEEGDISDDDVPRSTKKKSSPKTATSGDGEWGIGSASDSDDDSKPVAVSKREWNALQRQVKELQKLVASVHDDERDAKRQRFERADTLVITTTPALRIEGEDVPVPLVTSSSMEIDSAIKAPAKAS